MIIVLLFEEECVIVFGLFFEVACFFCRCKKWVGTTWLVGWGVVVLCWGLRGEWLVIVLGFLVIVGCWGWES